MYYHLMIQVLIHGTILQVTSCEIPLEPSLSPSKRVKLTDSSTTAQSPARPQATRTQTYDVSMLYQHIVAGIVICHLIKSLEICCKHKSLLLFYETG